MAMDGESAGTGERIKETAWGFGAEMRGAAETLADEQKARVAQAAQGFAHALRRSADAFAQEGDTTIAHCADRAADHVEGLANTVRTQTWRDLAATVEDLARRRPELFFAGAVFAGYLAGRVLGAGEAEGV
jgi:hypothetical protein